MFLSIPRWGFEYQTNVKYFLPCCLQWGPNESNQLESTPVRWKPSCVPVQTGSGELAQEDAQLTLWCRENTGALCAADTWQGRLALGEKAYDYFKYRHFPFSGVTVQPGSWTPKWPPQPGSPVSHSTSDAAAHGKEEGCSKSSSLPGSGDICDRWSFQREDNSESFPTGIQCKLCTYALSLSLGLPQSLFGSGRGSVVGKPMGRLSLGIGHQQIWATSLKPIREIKLQ